MEMQKVRKAFCESLSHSQKMVVANAINYHGDMDHPIAVADVTLERFNPIYIAHCLGRMFQKRKAAIEVEADLDNLVLQHNEFIQKITDAFEAA